MVRISGFHPGDRGSIPLRATKYHTPNTNNKTPFYLGCFCFLKLDWTNTTEDPPPAKGELEGVFEDKD